MSSSSSRASRFADSLRPLLSLPGLLLLLLAGAFYLAYDDTFAELETYWVEGYNWQFLIPIAFVYMLWERRDIFQQMQYRPNLMAGSALLVLSCLLLTAGQLSSTHALRELSIISTLFALSLLLLGIQPTRRLFWPVSYLILMTSLPTAAIESLREPLKLISATMSADFLRFFGFAVYREGAFLYLPHITLEVADSCSGVNQLTSSIALGIPIAFTILNTWWKRLFIILVSAAFGIVMNWVRVILIALWHYNSAKKDIHGPHDIYGLPFIFLVGVFLTLVIAFAIADRHEATAHPENGPHPNPLARLFSAPGFRSTAIAAIAILSATAAYLHTWRPVPVALAAPAGAFPMSIAGASGRPVSGLSSPFHSQLADDEILATYRLPNGTTATVYIGYFRSQDQARELIDYRYNWLHRKAAPYTVPGTSLRMKRTLVRTEKVPRTVFFSYDINGRNIIDPKQAKLASLIDAFLKHRNNGAIIMVIFEGEKPHLDATEQQFLRAVMREARAILPS